MDNNGARIGERLIRVRIPAAGDCVSYHLVVAAPPALRVAESNAKMVRAERDADPVPMDVHERLINQAHLHVSEAGKLSEGVFSCRLVLSPAGFVRAAVASSGVALASLAAGAFFVWLPGVLSFVHGKVDPSAGTALFLLVPGAVGPLLAAIPKHPMTTSLLFPTRLFVWLSATASYIGAGTVALGVGGVLRAAAWLIAGALSVMAFVILWHQWRSVRRTSAGGR